MPPALPSRPAFLPAPSLPTRQSRPPRTPSRRPPLACLPPLTLPRTYDELNLRASRAARAALAAAATPSAFEIEFPAGPLSLLNIGSRAGDDAARRVNSLLGAHVAHSVGAGAIAVFDAATKRALADAARAAGVALCEVVVGCRGIESLADGAVVVAVAPGAGDAWDGLKRYVGRGGSVVVCNGLGLNGVEWAQSVFYVKPCSGWGAVLAEYPRDGFWAVGERSGDVVMEVQVLKQGRIRRPDLLNASKALMKDFYE